MRYRWELILISLLIAGILIPQDTPSITIFIHGSVGLRPYLAFDTIVKIVRDMVHDSPYHEGVKMIRSDSMYYDNQAIQESGFIPIERGSPRTKSSLGAWLTARIFDQINNDPGEHLYYTYGWSGLISVRERQMQAISLYRELRNLCTKYSDPRIRIIGYSHGGNIALNLAEIRENNPEDRFTIDELILLGTPIQRENEHYVCSPLFKRIYNCYSHEDRIQRMDCFSLKRFFSRRHFKNRATYKLPNNLVQVEIRILTNSKKTGKKRINKSPGHIEWWFFGWPATESHLYRKNFPLYPLPVVCFLPEIITTIDDQLPNTASVIFEWNVTNGSASLRKRHHYTRHHISFIPTEMVDNLQTDARSYTPSIKPSALYEAQHTLCTRIAERRMGSRNHRTHSAQCAT